MKINKIYNEDCLEGMKKIPDKKVDIVLTSPPYNIIRPNSTDRGYDVYKDGMSNEEYIEWTVNIFKEFERILAKDGCILWNMSYGTENTECMNLTVAEILKRTEFTLADIIIFKKKSATPNNVSPNKLTRIVEFVYVFCRRSETMTFYMNKQVLSTRKTGQKIYENKFNFIEADNNDMATELNKATFSTDFVKQLLNLYAKEGNIVLDCFIGTGTTAVGCIKKNCYYIGYEISEEQVKYANNRVWNEIAQPTFFRTIDYEKEVEI